MRHPLLACLVTAVSLLASSGARAADASVENPPGEALEAAPHAGFALGLRVGYGRALSSTSFDSLTTGTPSLLPLTLDAGYRIGHLYGGIYGQMAVASRTNCGGSTCSAKDYQLGINVHYHFRPERSIDPWVGFGIGYETLHLSGLAGFPDTSIDRKGIDYAVFQVGTDFLLGASTAAVRPHIGPFMALALGQMDDTRGPFGRKTADAHQWLTLGVRGTLDL